MTMDQDSLHGRFEQQAQHWPNQIALNVGSQYLTYQDLNTRANRQAQRLRASGVCAGDWVALMLPRGFDLIVQVLAVLKAGAGYVPIDPNYPRERVEWILQSSKPVCVLTCRDICAHLWGDSPPKAQFKHIRWMDVDNDQEQLEPLPGDLHADQQNTTAGLSQAYVIFTSGSTGNPKGVMVGHRQVLSLLDAVVPPLQCNHTDVWTLFHSLAFDFSVWELWGALTTGARLCIVPQQIAWSPVDFARLLQQQCVTVLNQTPSAFYALTNAVVNAGDQAAKDLSLRSVIFGGEAINLNQLKQWWAHYPAQQPRLINMYGITETTVHVTWLELSPQLAELAGSPIGDALPGLEVYLLNHALQPVSDGETGEIHVGGPQLAAGYLGRADLTASRFIASPFHEGQRLYRSGDLAVRHGGQLFYLGRGDRQLKVRGFRIEPAEIEAAIETHPDVQRCVVLPQPTDGGKTPEGLLAFIVATPTKTTQASSSPLNSTRLRQYLADKLPVHSLPSECLLVTQLPMTVNGKLDQTALVEQWRMQQQVVTSNKHRLDLLRARLANNPGIHKETIE